VITTVCLNSTSRKFTENCIAADISDLREVGGNIIWADVADPTSRDFEELAEEFGFHHLSIEDCQNAHQRPKVEEYPGYIKYTALAYRMAMNEIVYAPFYALFIVGPVALLVEQWLDSRKPIRT